MQSTAQPTAQTVATHGTTRQGIGALLSWWMLAGADTRVHDQPVPWFGATPEKEAAASTRRQATNKQTTGRPATDERATDDWRQFRSLDELRCHVLDSAPGTPFADGVAESGLMLIGEGPSAEDLRSGRPFSGPAGRFLDRMLAAIGLDRARCYVSLVAPRWKVPGAVPPDGIAADLALTRAHIRLARPRLVVLLGAKPTAALSGETTPIGRIRGQWLSIEPDDRNGQPVPALAMFNPAYLLRRPEAKADAWRDLLCLADRLGK